MQSAAPDGPADWAALETESMAASAAVADLPRKLQGSAVVTEALEAVRTLTLIRSNGGSALTTVQSPSVAHATGGWPALLASMLATPAWCGCEVPSLDQVPDWLWGDYAAWLFAHPHEFTAVGEAERYSTHTPRHLEVLARWVERNAASAAVASAAEAYEKGAAVMPLCFAPKNFRRLAELRGAILSRHAQGQGVVEGSLLRPRAGRPLRVGFVGEHFGSSGLNRALLPLFADMDPLEFETLLFSLNDVAPAVCTRAKEFHVLPAEVAAQISLLREAMLDVLVFTGEVGVKADALTRVALERVAPLQIVAPRNGLTSGLPEIDVYLSATLPPTAESGADFSERVGLVRGPSEIFALEATRGDAIEPVTREALGLPAVGVVFSALVTPRGVSAETASTWVRALASNPGARLLLVLAAPAEKAQRLGHQFETILKEHGVESDRVVLLPVREDADARGLLRVADVYLHSLEGFDAVWVAEALMLGLPVVAAARPDAPDRDAPARLLSQVGLAEFAATDAAGYETLVASLAADGARRTRIRGQINEAVEAGPDFLDTLAASDAFGALLETAYDELCALETCAFRAQREPLRCFSDDDARAGIESAQNARLRDDMESAIHEARLALRADPVNADARALYGQLLATTGRPGRGVVYLLAAVQRRSGDAKVWLALAEALRADGQMNEAVQALESALRADEENVEGWLLLMDLAEGAGATDLATEALNALKRLAPGDPRVVALS
ncbi:MAG: tetratricopeptide repeat protein [Undibacterium sp.]|nr:tetratricopeptide repeat protein [Opitutaceae bacterium]